MRKSQIVMIMVLGVGIAGAMMSLPLSSKSVTAIAETNKNPIRSTVAEKSESAQRPQQTRGPANTMTESAFVNADDLEVKNQLRDELDNAASVRQEVLTTMMRAQGVEESEIRSFIGNFENAHAELLQIEEDPRDPEASIRSEAVLQAFRESLQK